ncbi:MAG: GNAT family N-acetyltransferase [Candidatus Alcyoniella australis]|nr:GNAT family N-acetyltransferase [Candidatus Alcyoniella australis]
MAGEVKHAGAVAPGTPGKMTLEVRGAALNDLDALVELDARCFEPGIAYDHATFFGLLVDSKAYAPLLLRDNRLIAFAIALRSKSTGHLVTIDIDDEFRRQGLAQQLLAMIVEHFVGLEIERIELEVNTANTAAYNFYLKNGFTISHTERNYYGPGRDAYIMLKQLVKKSE